MDLVAATSTGDNKRHVNKKNRNWHKRLHPRKTVVQPPAMQSEDKHGPKKIAEEWEQTIVWPSSKKPPQEAQQSRRMTNDGESSLRFMCSQCKDNLEYAPKDLMRHFEEKHRGSLPVFPCHVCNFSTHEFSHLQVHLLSHKDTFASCCICNDNVQRSWSEFSAHLATNHCPDGKYSCERCQKFSTGDVSVFLEHIYGHDLDLEAADGFDGSLLKKDNQIPTTQTLRCQYCDFEASQKILIEKHVDAVHVCQNGNKRKRDLHPIAVKPNDKMPRMKPRLTRSAVRDMCWITQDCLSLPGTEFLDKYCHLSDPQTTLEETQQFLMKSVAGETDDQKWTKALKTVLSNVPKDMNLHPKLENGIVLNPSDLAVLKVKNKITVGQNGATYSKMLEMMTSTDKETVSVESASGDAHCAVSHNGCATDLKDQTPCPQAENGLFTDVLVSVQNEPSQCAQMQENIENRNLKTDQEVEEHKKLEGSMHADGIHISANLMLTKESEDMTPVHRAIPRRQGQNHRRKRKRRFRKVDKRLEGQALKIVLKKNPVKGKQWVSQSSFSASGDDAIGLVNPHTAMEGTVHTLRNVQLTEVHQRNIKRGSTKDPLEAITSIPEPEPEQDFAMVCSVKPVEPKNMTGNELDFPLGEVQVDAGKSQLFLETEVDGSRSVGQINPGDASATEVEMPHENTQLQKPSGGADCHVMESKKTGVTLHSSGKSSPVSQTALPPQDELNVESSCLESPAEQSGETVEEMKNWELPAETCRDLTQREPSPAFGRPWQPTPKHQERTLKLVALNPAQLIKRPTGDQPVVVLNHPDANIPQVAKIMEVVNKYREVHKVILSRRTLNALAALDSELPVTNGQTDAQREPAWQGENLVQERFTLKLKLRRLSRKKYEIVGAVSPSKDFVSKLPCWFCGRIFTSQETMMAHRQRHLMEWKRPKCEKNLNVAHTG